MKIAELKEIAFSKGINKPKGNKVDLIREIQAAEGNNCCFSTGISDVCGQNACLWREDCV
ncbi:MAG TPA: SAP domain-containing protein [Spirochaetota bacterium]